MIAIQYLSRRYGSFCAVRRISLTIPDGSIFGLPGPNGAGKSTPVGLGILKASDGRITVEGVDVTADPIGTKKRVGYVPKARRYARP